MPPPLPPHRDALLHQGGSHVAMPLLHDGRHLGVAVPLELLNVLPQREDFRQEMAVELLLGHLPEKFRN